MLDESATLQRMLYDSQVVDLGGRVWVVRDPVLVWPFGGRRTIRKIVNGTVLTQSVPLDSRQPIRYGIFELLKGVRYRGRDFDDGELVVEFEGVNFVGSHSNLTDVALVNQSRAKTQGFYTGGITCIDSSRVDSLRVNKCSFFGLFQGVAPQQTINFLVRDSRFERIAGAAVVSSYAAGSTDPRMHTIYRSQFNEVGSGFDFSTIGPVVDAGKTPFATVRLCNFTNVFGRTKVHGRWDTLLSNLDFEQKRLIPSPFAAMGFPSAKRVEVEDTRVRGFLQGAINVPASSVPGIVPDELKIVELEVDGGHLAINASCPWTISDSTLRRCYLPWGDSTKPRESSVVSMVSPETAEQQARRFVAARQILRDFNRQHTASEIVNVGVGYITPEIKARIDEIEEELATT